MPNKRPTRLFEMPGADIVEIEITRPLPGICSAGLTYHLEGTVKVAGIGAPPWVYAEVTPLGIAGEVTYERGLPKPMSGEFSIDLRFTYTGDYEITVLATPAPQPLPVVGVEPVVGKSAIMTVEVVGVAPPGAEFEVSNLIISPTEVNPGQVVTISCLVTNIGGEAGSYTVHLGGDFMASKTVSLGPGESTTVSFPVTPTAAGTYNVSADGLYGSFVATEEAVADIRVENLAISPSEVMVGEPVSISVTATNYGTKAGSKTIICNVT
ncbi:hypothetical protein ES708_22811 [subsurface metagenome]